MLEANLLGVREVRVVLEADRLRLTCLHSCGVRSLSREPERRGISGHIGDEMRSYWCPGAGV